MQLTVIDDAAPTTPKSHRTANAIVAEGLVKRFGKVRAVDGLHPVVPEGGVVGLLTPNRAPPAANHRPLQPSGACCSERLDDTYSAFRVGRSAW
jgi:hypothetical protein